MLARGKMDGAWAFWQHRCCSRWQLLDSEEEHRERTRKDRDAGRIRKRKREREWFVLEVLPKERRAVGERNATQPPPYDHVVCSSALCPFRPFSLPLATSCDAFGAPRLVIRVIYAALIASRRTITARLSRPASSLPLFPDSSFLYRWI